MLQGVGEEVQEDPLDLIGRAANQWGVAELPVEGDAAGASDRLDSADAGVDERSDGDDLELV